MNLKELKQAFIILKSQKLINYYDIEIHNKYDIEKKNIKHILKNMIENLIL